MAERRVIGGLRADAIARLSDWAKRAGAAPLGTDDLQAYALRRPVCGWRFEPPIEGKGQILDLFACENFPWQPVQIAWANRPAFLSVPHVERDGVLCQLTGAATTDIDRPEAVAAELLRDAAELLEKLLAGDCVDDFRSELLTYWSLASESHRKPLVSLCQAEGLSRTIRIWRCATFSVVADDDETIARWLTNCGYQNAAAPGALDALLAVLPLAPVPRQYPNSGKMIVDLLASSDRPAREIFDKLVAGTTGRLAIVFAVATTHGRALIAADLYPTTPRRIPGRRPQDVFPGFRSGRAPERLVVLRKLRAAKIDRLTVDRADAAWIHGRGQDQRQHRLGQTRILLVGAGSLGAPIAQLLAQAGIGRLTVVDKDILSRPNTSRHVLGADAVGHAKAEALEKKLRRDFPHISEVIAISASVETALAQHEEAFETADVIICATGDWAANRAVADWRRARHSGQTVIYGWTEAHACAGQAVATIGSRSSLHGGFSATGAPLLRVTDWPEEAPLRQEPACGSVFQPYGAVEMSHTASLVAEMALDAVNGGLAVPTHRIWAAPERQLLRNGGRWTPSWLKLNGGRTNGGFMLEFAWVHGDDVADLNASEAAE